MPRLALILALTALVAGCGSSSKANTQRQAQDDAIAKATARIAVTEIEACFVDRDAYTGCEPSRPGVTATTTDTSYNVVSTSKSGNSFVVSKDANGGSTRTCTTAGDGGCPAAGAW